MSEDRPRYGFSGNRAKWIRWEFGVLLAFWLTYLFIPSVLEYTLTPYTAQPYRYLLGIGPSVGLVVLLLWILWMSGDDLEMFGIRRPGWGEAKWLGFLALVLLGVRAYSVYRWGALFAPDGSFLAQMREGLRYFHLGKVPLQFIYFLAPAGFEELLYRGAIQARAQEISGNTWGAIGGTAVLFAASHAYQGPQNLPFHLICGFAYSVARWRGCSLGSLIVLHALYNATFI